jgi:amino acid transporter
MSDQNNQGGSNLRRDLGLIGILFMAIGAIIGSGWLFGALKAAKMAGPAAIISWGIGGLMVLFIALNYAELGTMFPVSGGVIRYPDFVFGSFTSYTFGWAFWMSCASSTTIEVLAALQYARNYLPWLQHLGKHGNPTLSLPGYGVAIALLAIFAMINVTGIRWIQRVNTTLVWWKIGIVILVIVAFVVTLFHVSNFADKSAGGFTPMGWEGVFAAVSSAGVVFSFLGFRQGVDLAGEVKNPKRVVPIAVIGSILITTLLYVGLEVAFVGGLPLHAMANGWENIGKSFTGELSHVAATFGPLAAIASFMGLSWLAVLLYIDAFISPADTSLIYTTVTTRLSYAMGKNRNAPASLAKVNDQGVPWVSAILTFVAGGVFLWAFPGWGKLVGFVTSATIISFGTGPIVLLTMRLELPDKERPFRLPWAYVLSYTGFYATNLIFFWTGWIKIYKLMIAIGVGYIIFIIHEIVNKDKTPPLEWRSGIWVVVWLGGMTILSWLGPYPEMSKHGGNLGLFGVPWGIPILAVFSLLVMWLAVRSRLPAEKVKKSINQAEEEMESNVQSGSSD